MSKKLDVKIGKWIGSVTIADPMTLPQVMAFEKALQASGDFFEDVDGKRVLKADAILAEPDAEYLRGVLPSVEEWNIEGFPENIAFDNFPATPRAQSREFFRWLFMAVMAVYIGEVDIPNE